MLKKTEGNLITLRLKLLLIWPAHGYPIWWLQLPLTSFNNISNGMTQIREFINFKMRVIRLPSACHVTFQGHSWLHKLCKLERITTTCDHFYTYLMRHHRGLDSTTRHTNPWLFGIYSCSHNTCHVTSLIDIHQVFVEKSEMECFYGGFRLPRCLTTESLSMGRSIHKLSQLKLIFPPKHNNTIA